MSDEVTSKDETAQNEAIEPQIEPVSEPIEPFIPQETEVPKEETTQTVQIPVSEPLASEPEIKLESVEILEVKTEEVSPVSEPVVKPEPEVVSSQQTQAELISEPEKIVEIKSESKPDPKPEPEPEQPKIIPVIISTKKLARELLVKARNAIQTRKRKKLNQIMTLFAKRTKITNDEVEKLLHVSDATATRYLNILQKENLIKQNGKTGKYVFYSKI